MKRILALLLVAVLIFSMAGCGKKSSGDGSEKTETVEKTTKAKKDTSDNQPANTGIGLANPWEDVDADTLYSYLGFRFTEPEKAKDIVYRWEDADGIGEIQFTLNKVEWTARAKQADEMLDISGMNYVWENSDTAYLTNYNFELDGEYYYTPDGKKTAHMANWFYQGATEDYQYTFTVSCVTDKDVDISDVASQVIVLEGAGADDATKYGQGYWEEKYPGYSICPFYINVNGEDQYYYWATGYEGSTGDIHDWVGTDFNWNGWHIIGNYIVDKDEKWRITTESMKESFSSCCTYYTEKFDPDDPFINAISFNYDKRYQYFTDLVKQTGGIEIVYKNNDDTTYYCGGKDNIYWYVEIPADGDSLYYIAELNGDEWTCKYMWYYDSESHGDIDVVDPEDAIWRICEKAYYNQWNLDFTEITPMDCDVAGRAAERYSVEFGAYATDIDKEFNVTLSYSDINEAYNSFCAYDVFVGDAVEVAEFPVE
ncbi:MAG: hypothetical protein Q4B67_05815 [Eubacteriales bacterium]|nr:hypothetical protein [Eubacteriales bacterium]